MKQKFSSSKEFRANATDNDYKALHEYYMSASSADWKSPDCPYGFSRSFAATVLKERGLLGTKARENKANADELPIRNKCNGNQGLKAHTLYLSEETYQGLERAFKHFNLAARQTVTESLMYDVLVHYGFIE